MQCDKYLGLAMAMRTNNKKSTDRLEKKIDDLKIGKSDNFTPLGIVAPNIKGNVVYDAVNHPQHYCTGKYECIDVMLEIFGIEAVKTFCLLNAFKYNYRSGRKNGLEDIQKAKWYIDKYIELSE
jgi:hypothetical protein|nr:MAG TPA: nucelotide kinase [Bacteriophage sp.]